MYLVFTLVPGGSYRRRLRSLLLGLCDVSQVPINSVVCGFCTGALGLVLFQMLPLEVDGTTIFVLLAPFLFFSFCNHYLFF